MKDKSQMIYQQVQKNINKSQYPFVVKTLKKLGTEGMYPNTIRAIDDKFIAYVIENEKKTEVIFFNIS